MAKLKKYIPIVVFLLFMAVGVCNAKSDSVIKFLQNEPVSMLDWGIYKLEQHLTKELINLNKSRGNIVFGPVLESSPYVIYDVKSNRIIIGEHITYDDIKVRLLAEEGCREHVNAYRRILCVDLKTGEKIKSITKYLGFTSLFAHIGYSFSDEYEDKIYEIIEIKINAFYNNSQGFIRCKAPLLGTEIFFSSEKAPAK